MGRYHGEVDKHNLEGREEGGCVLLFTVDRRSDLRLGKVGGTNEVAISEMLPGSVRMSLGEKPHGLAFCYASPGSII